MKRFTNTTMGCLAVLTLSASATAALTVPADAAQVAGPLLLVNVTTDGDQRTPAVAFAANGTSLVAWESTTSPGSDNSGRAILARRFAPDGTPVGAEFQVNSTTTGDQYDPAVAVNASGAFAIVWTSADGASIPYTDPACGTGEYAVGATVDCSGTGIRGQMYTSAGVASGPEMLVNGGQAGGTTPNNQHQPDVALADDGTLLTVWTTEWTTFDGSGSGIAGRRGSTFLQANATHTGDQRDPTVAVNAGGAFVIAWTSADGALIPDTDPSCGSGDYATGATVDCDFTGIRGQRYTSAGVASGPEMLVNGGPAGGTLRSQTQPDVALADDGTLLSTWTTTWTTFDGSGTGIAGRWGSTFFQANTTHLGSQFDPTVAMNADGAFAMAWTSEDGQWTAGSDPGCGDSPYGAGATIDCHLTGIRGRVFTSAGSATGPDMLVNGGPAGGTPEYQSAPAVGLADDGTVLTTWATEWTTFDGSGSAVAGRYFRPAPPQPPVANPDAVSTDEDSPLTFDVRENDTDAGGDPGALSVSITTGPSHGTATVGSDQRITYTPDAGYNGPDSLSYQVADSSGLSSTAQVAVTVRAVNDAPTAVADSFTVPPAGSSLAVLMNDSDVDGDSLTPVIVAGPTGGTAAAQADGTIIYTPAAGTTTDTFTYRAHDGQLESSTVSVTIAVTPAGPELAASIQQPIDSTGDPSTFSAKRGVVPVKWRLTADGASTCVLPTATIRLERVAGAATGPVDEGTFGGASDSGTTYRVADCQYSYNLDAKRLGPGSYQVSIIIDGRVEGTAAFELR